MSEPALPTQALNIPFTEKPGPYILKIQERWNNISLEPEENIPKEIGRAHVWTPVTAH